MFGEFEYNCQHLINEKPKQMIKDKANDEPILQKSE